MSTEVDCNDVKEYEREKERYIVMNRCIFLNKYPTKIVLGKRKGKREGREKEEEEVTVMFNFLLELTKYTDIVNYL